VLNLDDMLSHRVEAVPPRTPFCDRTNKVEGTPGHRGLGDENERSNLEGTKLGEESPTRGEEDERALRRRIRQQQD